MDLKQAQYDVRTTFQGGFAGQLVSGVLWLTSAVVTTWSSPQAGIAVLIIAGFFIFPLTQLVLKLMGQCGSLEKGHPMNGLAMQTAFIVPLTIPVILAAASYDQAWFYPAFMIIVGAHYLPFTFLYGMKHFLVLGGILVLAGFLAGLYLPTTLPLATGAWFTGVVLCVFAVIGYQAVQRETGHSYS